MDRPDIHSNAKQIYTSGMFGFYPDVGYSHEEIPTSKELQELEELREWRQRLADAGIADGDIEALVEMKGSGLTAEDIRNWSVFKGVSLIKKPTQDSDAA